MASISLNGAELLRVAARDVRYHAYMRRVADRINDTARGVFNSRQRKDNEGRLSETTPPKYVDEFYVRQDGLEYYAGNSDRSAMWVEFGALVGGNRMNPPQRRPPMVLKYRPLSTAIEMLETRGGV